MRLNNQDLPTPEKRLSAICTPTGRNEQILTKACQSCIMGKNGSKITRKEFYTVLDHKTGIQIFCNDLAKLLLTDVEINCRFVNGETEFIFNLHLVFTSHNHTPFITHKAISEAEQTAVGIPKGISFGHGSTGTSPPGALPGLTHCLRRFQRSDCGCKGVPALCVSSPMSCHAHFPVQMACISAVRLGTEGMYLSALCCTGIICRAFFFKVHRFCVERETHQKRIGLCWQNPKTCYNAVDQLCFQSEPHIFIHMAGYISVCVLHRSCGEESNVSLVMGNHSSECIRISLCRRKDDGHRNQWFYRSDQSNPSFSKR